MKILLILLGMLFTCGLAGTLLIFTFRANTKLNKLALPIGYAYTLIAFYVLYMQFNSAVSATLLTVAIPLLLGAASLLVRGLKPRLMGSVLTLFQGGEQTETRRDLAYPVMVSLIVVLLAAWPYLFAGWGNYWHSGNYDMEDGLNGRDAYISNLIIDERSFDVGTIIGDKSWQDFAKVTGTLAKRAHEAETYKEWYAGDGFRFQYSSLAFWSVLFDEIHGIDILLMQLLLNLVLMSTGIYYLSRLAFLMAPVPSALAALISVVSTFYLSTYYAGHVGSLMYGAMIPALLYLALSKDNARPAIRHQLVFGGLIAGAIAFSYPHPLVIIALPLLAYRLLSLESIRKRNAAIWLAVKTNPRFMFLAVIVFTLVLGLVMTGLWQVTESYRLRQDGQYRAWGYTHDWLIIPLFLGLIPSPGEGSIFIGSILGKYAYLVLILISGLFAAILGAVYFKARPPRNAHLFPIFGIFWIVGFLIFKYFIIDSYYLYKFIYVHQFVFVIGVVAYIYRARSRFIKILGAAVVLANLASDLVMGYGIFHRPYNDGTDRVSNLIQFDRTTLQKSFIELTGGDGISVRQTLKAHGIETTLDPRFANYFIVPSGHESDITGAQFTETLAEEGGLAIKRAPESNYLMIRTWMIRTWNEPELFPADPILKNTVFRWMGHGKNDNLGIYVIRPGSPDEMRGRFLRVCIQKGPSAQGNINMAISAAGKEVLSEFTLHGGIRCEWLPAEKVVGAPQPLVLRSGARGKSLLPHDDRILLYRVFAVGWSDKIYDDRAISFFNSPEDIVKHENNKIEEASSPRVVLRLGQGWEAYENFGGETFRWTGSPVDLILTDGIDDGTVNVALDLEPGPSHGTKPLKIEVLDRDGNIVFTSAEISGRETIVVPLSYAKRHTDVYTLRTNSASLPFAGDPRILNYRVFSIKLQNAEQKTYER